MSTATVVPAPLEAAIRTSASKNDVPKDLLEGIWRVESGSSYPNPYVNSSGYGGLFGTALWNGPTQAQANLAGSILANLLRKKNGDISSALSAYSGGGYTSVPGQITFGTYVPKGGSGGGGITGAVSSAAGDAAGAVGGAVSGAAGAVGGAADSVLNALDPSSWVKGLATWVQSEAATGLAYVVFTMLGIALIVIGLADALGYSPTRIASMAGAPGKAEGMGEVIPF